MVASVLLRRAGMCIGLLLVLLYLPDPPTHLPTYRLSSRLDSQREQDPFVERVFQHCEQNKRLPTHPPTHPSTSLPTGFPRALIHSENKILSLKEFFDIVNKEVNARSQKATQRLGTGGGGEGEGGGGGGESIGKERSGSV